MIHFITGLPGAGKGYYCVMQMEQELRTTDRPIITNFAIRLKPWLRQISKRKWKPEKGFLAYLEEKYGQTFNAEKRIHCIDDDQAQEFYLWRCNEKFELVRIKENRDEKGKLVDFDKNAFTDTVPCVIMIDEAWKFWNARQFSKCDLAFLHYNAQHRKGGDDLYIMTQKPGQVDKQLRDLVQNYHTLVNHKYRKIGMFRQPNVISVITSNEPPEERNKSLAGLPKVIRFDKEGIGGSFDTAAGAGVQGMAADIHVRAKGLPSWMIVLGVIGVGVGLVVLAKSSGWLAGKLLTGTLSKPAKQVEQSLSVSKEIPVVASVVTTNYNIVTNDLNEVFIVGLAELPTSVTVMLSDGAMFNSKDSDIEYVKKKNEPFKVKINGKEYSWNRKIKQVGLRMQSGLSSESALLSPVESLRQKLGFTTLK